MRTARMDLDNGHGNTQYGVHTAAMAGSWLGLVQGFGGMRTHDGRLRFAPTLPARWRRYAFRLRVGAAQLQVSVDGDGVEYRLLHGAALAFEHRGEPLALSAEQPVARIAHAAPQPLATAGS
jgi:alpha,alpha-trehalose phosphorylase